MGKGYGSRKYSYLPNCVYVGDIAKFKLFAQKPELPYAVGSCFKARPHTPRQLDNDNCEFDINDIREVNTVDPLHRCLLHPPPRGRMEPGVVTFKIVGRIQAGDPNNTQVVSVGVLDSTIGLPTDIDILAKIYDPLYFNHIQDDVDIFRYTEYCYNRERAAYKHLVALQGSIILKYYGSFTISLPVDGEDPRDVRLILLENVPGSSMNEMDPSSFKQAERQEIMKAVADAERAVYTHKVVNTDIHPRNILIPPNSLDRGCRAVIVDFGLSYIISSYKKIYPLTGVTRTGPLFHCLDPDDNFREWVDWDWDAWINAECGHIKGSSRTFREECVLYNVTNRALGC
ncbi:hypothetical protein V495_04666 [Pseudogymnoascus sp. VKM F-4514 (FW-929)]|nr:hypothetical protein V495_04666 [Pseudogymnoascus sp. VKM F-4514 (FW-929)]KFY51569.1 hypothetical protein V497_09018 [Pseudogymnoascus sp. VKM F-4516 (FW-969)]